jgi:thiol:disulfide interchange protein DsbA
MRRLTGRFGLFFLGAVFACAAFGLFGPALAPASAQAEAQDPAQTPPKDPAQAEKPAPPYKSTKPAATVRRWDDSDDKVEVLYFFWYGCPTCKMIDEEVSEMAQRLPEGVRFQKLPAAFAENPDWRAHANLFWALESLGVEKDLHSSVFNAVQPGAEGSHGPTQLLSAESQKSFAKANKLDPVKFGQILASPFVQNQLSRIFDYLDAIDLSSVPAFVVNGRYLVYVEGRRPITDFTREAERLALEELAKKEASPAKSANPASSADPAANGKK